MANPTAHAAELMDADHLAPRRPQRRILGGRAAVSVAVIALAAGVITYGTATGFLPIERTPEIMSALVAISLGLLAVLVGLTGLFVWRLWRDRQRGMAGARLNLRLVVLFALVAVVPAIVVAGFSAITLNLGLQTWFSEKVGAVMNHSVNVAEVYLEEHATVLRGEAMAMAQDVTRFKELIETDPRRFAELVQTQTIWRNLHESVVFDLQGEVYARSGVNMAEGPVQVPTPEFLEKIPVDEAAATVDFDSSRVLAVARIGEAEDDIFLQIRRDVNEQVVAHVARTRAAISEYTRMEEEKSTISIGFAVFYTLISVLVLMSAMWLGLWFSGRLVAPIGALINAADRVGQGDLTARVRERAPDSELETLRRTFNAMTGQIESQRDELIETNAALDERRRFIEGVLEGVSAGVLSLDPTGRIMLVNRSAQRLLRQSIAEMRGKPLQDAVPEMTELFAEACARASGSTEGEVTVRIQKSGTEKIYTLHVRMVAELTDASELQGFIVTFDDMTRLVSAQRMAAWADVARRVAHEIKNPLTPIQLSAERLKRKYSNQLADPQVFDQCTDTIIRHVGDIGRMVDEFSSFARMPRPRMAEENVGEIVRQAVFLHEVAHSHITFAVRRPDHALKISCDARLVGQALTNLLKNAVEAIDGRHEAEPDAPDGRVSVALDETDTSIEIRITDNGRGLPAQVRHRLTEPYVTTRDKGTGLGLAIVKKVMEEHGGSLTLDDAAEGTGATVVLSFPKIESIRAEEPANPNVAEG